MLPIDIHTDIASNQIREYLCDDREQATACEALSSSILRFNASICERKDAVSFSPLRMACDIVARVYHIYRGML
jgi:hypothetical protein